MKPKSFRRLNPETLTPVERLATAVIREIIIWDRDNPGSRYEFDPIRQYEPCIYIFNKVVARDLKNKYDPNADGLLDQINLSDEASAEILKQAGIGYPLPITKPRGLF